MRRSSVRVLVAFALVVSTFAVPAARATCGGGGGGGMGGAMPPSGGMSPQVYFVPWKVLNPGDEPAKGALILYWIPATREEIRRSELLASRPLTMYAAQCVGMQVIRPDDEAMIEKLGETGKLPAAVLADSGGKVLAKVDSDNGGVRLNAVEKMVRDELSTREGALDKLLDDARKSTAADKDGATALYKQVWEQRCLFPRKGRDAQKALKKLGVPVEDAAMLTIEPDMSAATTARIVSTMERGLHAELEADYLRARTLYLAASRMDPADAVPLRFLGELDRHHLGDWKSARATFERILAMRADPLSRAAALHGIGKMTIHEGDSQKGLALFEQSVATYPLALTYRNMAVYWNSERERAKADAYVQKALALDPDEPFNVIFAATYLADSGRREEALTIAKQHEGMLCASYNLAAIYALLGEKGKAMELLHRHFYEFERYDAVRAKEMWEARVDYVFASIKDDPKFIELTKLAN
ncbi:MAG TPA: tetratricopeptide repeat protein [Thermoanaerobaculia bacterium]|nr:tetratricopeptide repeat protein [Thermoanaerobaculia bacterium]